MEDYKVLIYLVLSILYFLFKGRGKKKKPVTRSKPQPAADEQRPATEKKAKSFEEILAELSGEKEEEETVESQPTSEYLDDKEDIKSLADQVEERPMKQAVSQQDYENADETLKELYRKGDELKTLDELVDIDKIQTQSDRFKEFEEEKEKSSLAAEIREGLADADSARKAIIYSEIFNRRY